jgi:hypothetical protein
MRSALAFLVVAALGAAGPAYSHGIWTETAPGGGTRVTVNRENGQPLAGAPFAVQAPPDGTTVQTGRAGPDGRFAFTPTRAGAWRVRIEGEAGHVAVITVEITPDILAGRTPVLAAAHLHGARVDSVAALPDSLLAPSPGRRVRPEHEAPPPG